jgi:membrane protease subunit HflC
MSDKTLKFLAPLIAVLGFLGYLTFFTVTEVQQAIVLQFGDPKRIIQKAGLNFKIPVIQNVVFLDTRILNLDAPPEEVIASDQKRLIVDAFARFKIKDPLQFYISVGNERVARSRLSTIVNARIRGKLRDKGRQKNLEQKVLRLHKL